MKHLVLLSLGFSCFLNQTVQGQGSAFSYQGHLNDGIGPANGSYDFQFTLYGVGTGGTPLSGPITNLATIVNNGLFTSTIDFGEGVFNGASYWLDIAVCTNGLGAFIELSPRQQLTPTPYALFANSSSNLLGTLSAEQLTGILGSSSFPTNPVFFGTVAGNSFAGNGVGVTNVNAAALNGMAASNFWQLSGNNVAAGQFIGSTNTQAVELWVNGLRALRLEPAGTGRQGPPNVIGGSQFNSASGTFGATIAGGGATNSPNLITASFGTIGGGVNNAVESWYGTVGGGYWNIAYGSNATASGGWRNYAYNNSATVGGGSFNTASGQYTTVGGGLYNGALFFGYAATIGGGFSNSATADYSSICGGAQNVANAPFATVGGGQTNQASANYGTVAGGLRNIASSAYAVVPGGAFNIAGGAYSLAAGNGAQATNDGAFVWSDATGTLTSSSSSNQFVARASGGFLLYSDTNATGVSLAPGSGSWSSLSDRNAKKDFAPVNSEDVLEQVAKLPLAFWTYKTQGRVRHLGPMAQDFYTAFRLGEDDKHIAELDEGGVALAAIQGLKNEVDAKQAEIESLKQSVAELKAVVSRLTAQQDDWARVIPSDSD